MQLEMDGDVKAVAEFMQQNIPASKLVGVATVIGQLAPILWGRFPVEDVIHMRLQGEAISDCDQRKLSVAT